MALHETWSIKSRSHTCSITERKFDDGESFYTAIFPDPESSGYLRKDFSTEAWNDRNEDETPPFSFWTSIYHAPVKEEEVQVTEESPENLLRRLIEEDEEHTENARYILAIMLERKKQLVEADSQPTATGIIRIYEQRKTGDVFIVKDPNIPLDDIEKIQEEVSELLEHGGRKPEPEETTDTEKTDTENPDSESHAQADEAEPRQDEPSQSDEPASNTPPEQQAPGEDHIPHS
ncbi:hypothetical protein HW115_04205 [Verrucomicrobiaceae bacterium N1E253]|uniref:Uncharacterized protein n=1 Tax=Oceaniferula marina TaxID=2748318 RepID=A0A851GI39_9BACT|nr:hypothetical protein [Oceaniferula marina]NWK54797.1 hypothetical protein [Oceaniferula marina]